MDNKNYDILIIDDEEVIITAIEKIAEFNDYTSLSATNPKEAIRLLEENNFKLIISDIMMPEMDGFQFLEIVMKKKIDAPVIMTTGFSTLENAVDALYYGAISFVPKPFTLEELSSVFKRGMRYSEIFKNFQIQNRDDDLLSVIPCPPKYFRLGYDSWLKEEFEGTVKIGVTDLFLKSIEGINSIELLNIDDSLHQGSVALKISDSNEDVHQVLSPISGKIININEKIELNNDLLEKDPYFDGWVYQILPFTIEDEVKKLISCSSDI